MHAAVGRKSYDGSRRHKPCSTPSLYGKLRKLAGCKRRYKHAQFSIRLLDKFASIEAKNRSVGDGLTRAVLQKEEPKKARNAIESYERHRETTPGRILPVAVCTQQYNRYWTGCGTQQYSRCCAELVFFRGSWGIFRLILLTTTYDHYYQQQQQQQCVLSKRRERRYIEKRQVLLTSDECDVWARGTGRFERRAAV